MEHNHKINTGFNVYMQKKILNHAKQNSKFGNTVWFDNSKPKTNILRQK